MKKTSLAHRFFYEPDTREFLIVNDFLAVLTLVSVLSLILETVPHFTSYSTIFSIIEYTTVFFFTAEYIGRIIAQKKNVGSYIFSFFGIIDLLAIAPSFIGFSNLTFLKTARVLRIMRLLRMLRLAKVVSTQKNKKRDLEEYKKIYQLNIGIYFFALFSALTIFGTLIYIVEGDTTLAFSSIPLGMLWSAKLLLGGVSQIEPTTAFGEIISVCARFVGLVLFGLLIAIVGSVVKKILFGSTDIEANKKRA